MKTLNDINRLEDKLVRTTDAISAVILQLKINRLKKNNLNEVSNG